MSNSSQIFVNISDLSEAQDVADTDYLIIETQNGTEILEYSNFNVVRKDDNDNVTVTGSLTSNKLEVTNSADILNLSASNYFSNGKQGVTVSNGTYNRLTVTNGIVTSATYVEQDIIDVADDQDKILSGYLDTRYSRIFHTTGTVFVPGGSITTTSPASITLDADLVNVDIAPSDINVCAVDYPVIPPGQTPNFVLSGHIHPTSIVKNDTSLSFNVSLGQQYPASVNQSLEISYSITKPY